MSESPSPGTSAGVDRRLVVLGVLAALLFWVPIVAPFVQTLAAAEAGRAAWTGRAGRTGLLVAATGAILGFALFAMTQWVWIV
jgi:hypothetical protein